MEGESKLPVNRGLIAYVLISVPRGESEIVESLRKEKEVEEAYVVYGEFDVICKVRTESLSELTKFVVKKLRARFPVERTSTLIVAEI